MKKKSLKSPKSKSSKKTSAKKQKKIAKDRLPISLSDQVIWYEIPVNLPHKKSIEEVISCILYNYEKGYTLSSYHVDPGAEGFICLVFIKEKV